MAQSSARVLVKDKQTPSTDGRQSPESFRGWLLKWTNYIKGYQKRWFVLANGLLSYYRTQEEMAHTCRGTINLAGAVMDSLSNTDFVVANGQSQVFYLWALNEIERQRWVTALELAKARAIKNLEVKWPLNKGHQDKFAGPNGFRYIIRTPPMHLPQLTESIKEQQQQYEYKVLQEKASNNSNDANECNGSSEEEKKNTIEYNSMEESVPYTPESRTALHKELSEKRQEGTETKKERNPDPPKRERRLERDGRMLNVNEGRYEFKLEENDEKQCYIVDVACPRFMDTSLIECDVQPAYVRVTIKGKILQLVLPEEVSPDASNALRSQITGHLVVTMPKTIEESTTGIHDSKAAQDETEEQECSTIVVIDEITTSQTTGGSDKPLLPSQ